MTVRKGKMPGSLEMIRALGAFVLAMLARSACAPIESMKRELFPPEDSAAGDTRAASSRPSALPPLPRRKPEAISELTLAEADPERLVGLDFDATKALLGNPAAKHEEPPAEIWAYEGGTCSFNLFFYPSVDDKVFRVLAYEVTKETPIAEETAVEAAEPSAVEVRDKDNPMVRRCFAELLHNQQVPDAG